MERQQAFFGSLGKIASIGCTAIWRLRPVLCYSSWALQWVEQLLDFWLAEHGHDPIMGARPMARLIQEKIKKPLAEKILFGSLQGGGHIFVTVRDGELAVDTDEKELEEADIV